MSLYDVIIVGAGPAGLECAFQLRDTSLSVLLLERAKVIGPKVCAGGLSSHVTLDLPEEKTRSFSKEYYVFRNRKFVVRKILC